MSQFSQTSVTYFCISHNPRKIPTSYFEIDIYCVICSAEADDKYVNYENKC